jgi:hypothetical protein
VDRGAAARVSVKAVLLDADGVIQDAIIDRPNAFVRLRGTTDRLPEFSMTCLEQDIRRLPVTLTWLR